MADKKLNGRIVHKHDTAANWAKATTFIPMKGELIIYDIDDTYAYERFKIGDGETLVSELPFAIEAEHTHDNATTTTSGFMSAADKDKLDTYVDASGSNTKFVGRNNNAILNGGVINISAEQNLNGVRIYNTGKSTSGSFFIHPNEQGNPISIEHEKTYLSIRQEYSNNDVLVRGIANPENDNDATNKAYVDTAVSAVNELVGDVSVSEQITNAMTTIDYPVDSVNGKTGAIELTASDVGALPDTTAIPTQNVFYTSSVSSNAASGTITTNVDGFTYTVGNVLILTLMYDYAEGQTRTLNVNDLGAKYIYTESDSSDFTSIYAYTAPIDTGDTIVLMYDQYDHFVVLAHHNKQITKGDLSAGLKEMLVPSPTTFNAGYFARVSADGKDWVAEAIEIPSTDGLATETYVDESITSLVGDTPVATQISDAVANKVDKVSGKGLSTNDYTTTEKDKLSGIANGATKVGFSRLLSEGTQIGTLTINDYTQYLYAPTNTDTTYSAGTGISLSGTTFSNSGVRSIATGSANGTISVNTNGTSADVAINGLGSAAYTDSGAYDAAGAANSALTDAKAYADELYESITPDGIGALPITGGTVMGDFQTNSIFTVYRDAQWPFVQFTRGDVGAVGRINEQCSGGSTSNYFGFKQYSRSSTDFTALSYAENYSLPSTNADRTSDANYAILTSKNPVTVAQGGTGATTALAAANNLQVYSLGKATTITSNTDLNTLTMVGSYSCGGSGVSATLLNSPYTGYGFTLYVAGQGGLTNIGQELVPFRPQDRIYYRRYYNGEWSAWYAVPRYTNLNKTPADYIATSSTNDSIGIDRTLAFRSGAVPYGDTVDGSYNSPYGQYTSGEVQVDYGSLLRANFSNTYYTDLWFDANRKTLAYRQVCNGVSQGWKQLIDSSNYKDYLGYESGTSLPSTGTVGDIFFLHS